MAGGTCGVSASARPLHQFASQQTPEAQLQALQVKSVLIHKTANSGRYWASIIVAKRLQQFAAGVPSGVATTCENAELYAALATVLYYQASQL